MTAPTSSRSNMRFWLMFAAALVLVVIIVGGSGGDGPPYDPRSVNPDGAKGIVETLERFGVQVDLDSPVPQPDATAALMLRNRLTAEDEDSLREWVRNGGVLVVTDRTSGLAAEALGVSGFSGRALTRDVCTISALVDVERLETQGTLFNVGQDDSCFGDGNRAFVVSSQLGQGTVVSVGSPDVFTNAVLDEEDAAVLAVSLLAPTRDDARVALLGPSLVDFGEEGLSDLVPTRVWNAIWQLIAAFLLYALYRARRLGGVVAEPVPVHIEGSELVLKAGVLSQRAKDPSSAAQVLRHDVIQRARTSLSIPATDADEVVAERIASRIDLLPDDISNALLAPVMNEADLSQVSLSLIDIDSRLYTPGSQSALPPDEKANV